MNDVIQVLVADDQSLFVSGIEALLSYSGTCVVAKTTRDAKETLSVLRTLKVDVILLDVGLPDQSGIDTAKEIRTLGIVTPILILTNHDSKDLVLDAIDAGVQGYMLKDTDAPTLFMAITILAKGGRYLDFRLHGFMMDALVESKHGVIKSTRVSNTPDHYALTKREVDVLRLMVAGYDNDEIATALVITSKTARNHTTNILQKLGVPNRTKAVVLALSEHLVNEQTAMICMSTS